MDVGSHEAKSSVVSGKSSAQRCESVTANTGSADVGGAATVITSVPEACVQVAWRPPCDSGMLARSCVEEPVSPEMVMMVPCTMAAVVFTLTVSLLSALAMLELSDTDDSMISSNVMLYRPVVSVLVTIEPASTGMHTARTCASVKLRRERGESKRSDGALPSRLYVA